MEQRRKRRSPAIRREEGLRRRRYQEVNIFERPWRTVRLAGARTHATAPAPEKRGSGAWKRTPRA
jgi:hypothetical protein